MKFSEILLDIDKLNDFFQINDYIGRVYDYDEDDGYSVLTVKNGILSTEYIEEDLDVEPVKDTFFDISNYNNTESFFEKMKYWPYKINLLGFIELSKVNSQRYSEIASQIFYFKSHEKIFELTVYRPNEDVYECLNSDAGFFSFKEYSSIQDIKFPFQNFEEEIYVNAFELGKNITVDIKEMNRSNIPPYINGSDLYFLLNDVTTTSYTLYEIPDIMFVATSIGNALFNINGNVFKTININDFISKYFDEKISKDYKSKQEKIDKSFWNEGR
jgi:hypothetical protein